MNQFDAFSSYGTTCTGVLAYDVDNNVVALDSPSLVKVVWSVSVYQLRSTLHLGEQLTFKGNNLVNVTGMTVSFARVRTQDHSPVISGTFTLSVGATPINVYDSVSRTYSIYNIPYNVTAASLQAAFRQIAGFENVEVFRSGTPEYGAKWLISYIEYSSDVPDLSVSGSSLTGGKAGTSPQIAFYETRKHSSNILFNPVS